MTLKLLGHNCKHQQRFVKRKPVALRHCGLKLKFPKDFPKKFPIKIAILDKLYQYNSCYSKLEQH